MKKVKTSWAFVGILLGLAAAYTLLLYALSNGRDTFAPPGLLVIVLTLPFVVMQFHWQKIAVAIAAAAALAAIAYFYPPLFWIPFVAGIAFCLIGSLRRDWTMMAIFAIVSVAINPLWIESFPLWAHAILGAFFFASASNMLMMLQAQRMGPAKETSEDPETASHS